MLCLGVESTAHTFSCAVLERAHTGRMRILSDVRAVYRPPSGEGIHPREASRHHVDNAPRVLSECLAGAGVESAASLDAVAYAAGPGLGPCLRVGAVVARSISAYYSVPIHPVNHAVGHIDLGMMLTGASDPLVLLVSGGHTMLLAFVGNRWRVFGETLDITLGQMFDQFGRSLGYPSPCGRQIESLAGAAASRADGAGEGGADSPYVPLPYTVKGNDVSLSGLLSAAKRAAEEHGPEAASYSLQETAFAMVCEAVERALSFTGRTELLVVGGVAANARLSGMLRSACRRQGCRLYAAPLRYAGDCGSQIACTGLHVASASAPRPAGRGRRGRPGRAGSAKGAGVALHDAFVRQSWRLDGVDVEYRGGSRRQSRRGAGRA